jgi:hypothetical protein
MSALDVGAAPLIAAIVVAPAAARRIRRTALFCSLMAYAVGVASLLGRRR